MTLPNFWEVEIGGASHRPIQDERLTRGGPSMEKPGELAGQHRAVEQRGGRNAGRSGLRVRPHGGRRPDVRGRQRADDAAELRSGSCRSAPRTSGRSTRSSTYPRLTGGSAATYGGRYIFAHVDRSTYSMEVRLNYTFKPDLTLDFYGEPFAASGRYAIGDLRGDTCRRRGRRLTACPSDRSRCRTATSTCSRSAAISSSAGNGGPGARSIWCGSRTASRKRPSAPA